MRKRVTPADKRHPPSAFKILPLELIPRQFHLNLERVSQGRLFQEMKFEFDFLSITCNSIDLSAATPTHKRVKSLLEYEIDGILFRCGQVRKKGARPFKLEINPRQCGSYLRLSELLRVLKLDVDHRITRLDCTFFVPAKIISVDIFHFITLFDDISINDLYPARADKPRSRKYNHLLIESVIWGAKPLRISAYSKDKFYEKRKQWHLESKPGQTVFEMQVKDEKLKKWKIQTIEDLPKLAAMAPEKFVLNQLRFYDPTTVRINSNILKLSELRFVCACACLGFTAAKYLFTEESGGKFKRNIKDHLKPVTVGGPTGCTLSKIFCGVYKRDTRNWFTGKGGDDFPIAWTMPQLFGD